MIEGEAHCCLHCYRFRTKRLVLVPRRDRKRSSGGGAVHVRSVVTSQTAALVTAHTEWEGVSLCGEESAEFPTPAKD